MKKATKKSVIVTAKKPRGRPGKVNNGTGMVCSTQQRYMVKISKERMTQLIQEAVVKEFTYLKNHPGLVVDYMVESKSVALDEWGCEVTFYS